MKKFTSVRVVEVEEATTPSSDWGFIPKGKLSIIIDKHEGLVRELEALQPVIDASKNLVGDMTLSISVLPTRDNPAQKIIRVEFSGIKDILTTRSFQGGYSGTLAQLPPESLQYLLAGKTEIETTILNWFGPKLDDYFNIDDSQISISTVIDKTDKYNRPANCSSRLVIQQNLKDVPKARLADYYYEKVYSFMDKLGPWTASITNIQGEYLPNQRTLRGHSLSPAILTKFSVNQDTGLAVLQFRTTKELQDKLVNKFGITDVRYDETIDTLLTTVFGTQQEFDYTIKSSPDSYLVNQPIVFTVKANVSKDLEKIMDLYVKSGGTGK
jgi:hypothetical protein